MNKIGLRGFPSRTGRLPREESQSRDAGPGAENTADCGEDDFSDTRTAGKALPTLRGINLTGATDAG